MKGLDKLRRKLREIPEAAKAAARLTVVEEAGRMAGLMKGLVPRKSGELHDSIHVTGPGETTPPYSQPGGAQVAGPEQAIITAGDTDVRYAHLVEYGTAPHINGGMFEGSMHPGAKAQPFFWPAYRALRGKAKRKIGSTITKSMKQAALRGGSSP